MKPAFYSPNFSYHSKTHLMETWMGDNRDVLLNKRINHLVLPGTHQSGAYTVNVSKLLHKIPYVKKRIEKWSITQDYSITDQLKMGIRAFDLSISYVKDSYWISSKFIHQSLNTVLDQLQDFIQTHPSEVIVVNLSHDPTYAKKMTGAARETLMRIWGETLGVYMYPYEYEFPTYGQMIFRRKPLLTFYNHEYCWPTTTFTLKRFDQHDLQEVVDEITQWSEGFHNYYHRLFGIVYALKAKKRYIKGYVSLTEANTVLLDAFDKIWLKMRRRHGQINIIMMDFPSEDIIEHIVNSNLN